MDGRVAPVTGAAAGYSATKFGVVGFSEALRKEVFKENIRITMIEPGAVATELREDIAEIIRFAVSRPAHVNINEILIRPTDQER
jgi:NADP-dependent 3-hydroxy acid dehydrogenase YdfG